MAIRKGRMSTGPGLNSGRSIWHSLPLYRQHYQEKASNCNTLNFVNRNLKHCPRHCKEVAYFTLVRSTVEYGSAVYPHIKKDTDDKLEKINRQAARMMTNDFASTAAVSPPWWSISSGQLVNTDVKSSACWPWCSGLLAVPSTQLTPADQRTRANHQFKYRNISTNSTPYTSSPFFLVPSMEQLYYSYPRWSTLQHTRLVQESTISCRAHQSTGVVSQREFANYICGETAFHHKTYVP